MRCKNGWLNHYMEYTKYCESPSIFHFWAGVSTVASVLGRDIWWDLGYNNIYPNLFVVLVARSAGLKKTAACEIAMDLLYHSPIDLKIIADKLTNEYLLSNLGDLSKIEGKDAVGIVYAEELSVFIGPNALSSGLIATLTKLFNCPTYFPYKTKTSGQYLLQNCCLNMLGASTPEWLRLCMPSEALGGGFTGRMMFVTAVEQERSIAHPKRVMPKGKELEKFHHIKVDLIEDLIEFSEMVGEFVMTEECEEWYDGWYENRRDEQLPDPRLVSYYERRHATLVKLAMILSVTRGRKYVIEQRDGEDARMLLRDVESNMISAYEGITFSDSTKHVDRILGQIRKNEVISHSDLLKKNHFHTSADELRVVINTLIGGELIEEFFDGRKKYYRFKESEDDKKRRETSGLSEMGRDLYLNPDSSDNLSYVKRGDREDR